MARQPGRPGAGGRVAKAAPLKRADEVIEAAAELVAAKGYDATSMQDVADAVGLLKGSLYYYVASKDELLQRIIEPGYRAAMEGVQPILESDLGGLERLTQFVRAHVQLVVTNLTSFTVWLRDFEKLSTERRAEISAAGDTYYEAFRTLLAQAVDEELIDAGLDIHLVGTSVINLLNSLTQWYQPDGRLSADEVARHLEGFVLSGLVSDSAAAGAGGIEALRRSGGHLPG